MDIGRMEEESRIYGGDLPIKHHLHLVIATGDSNVKLDGPL